MFLRVCGSYVTADGMCDPSDPLVVVKFEHGSSAASFRLEEPTALMRKEAASAGFCTSPWGKHPRIQLVTIKDLLTGKTIDRPPAQASVTFKRAPKALSKAAEQPRIFGEDDVRSTSGDNHGGSPHDRSDSRSASADSRTVDSRGPADAETGPNSQTQAGARDAATDSPRKTNLTTTDPLSATREIGILRDTRGTALTVTKRVIWKAEGVCSTAIRDHEAIRNWADWRHVEPATGEATPSGPATSMSMRGGAGIRFNFPGAARFRPISWDESFDHVDQHHLVFVYPEERPEAIAARAYELWQSQGSVDGHDRDDVV